MSDIRKLALDVINILAGTQSRAETNEETVKAYAEALEQGVEFPPVVVFSDGSESGKWLADGFHRYLAHRKVGLVEITCDIRVGTLRDAKLFSNGANGTHGLPRTNADKHRAVMSMLADDEWKTWSQERIARTCHVSAGFVSKLVHEASLHREEMRPTVRIVERNGTTYELNTAKIGKPLAPVRAPSAPATLAEPPAPTASACSSRPTLLPQVDQQLFQADVTHEDTAGDAVSETPTTPEPDPFDQLLADYQKAVGKQAELQAQVDELKGEVEFLTQDDLAAEAQKWKANFEALSGRNRGLKIKLNEIEPEAKEQRDLLKQIRQVLGVERNLDILPALRARRAA